MALTTVRGLINFLTTTCHMAKCVQSSIKNPFFWLCYKVLSIVLSSLCKVTLGTYIHDEKSVECFAVFGEI